MRSRLLIGVGAWLLGAASATAGSLYAVGALGHSLLAPPPTQLSVKMVNADLAREKAQRAKDLPAARNQRAGSGQSQRHSKANRAGPAKSSPSPSQSASPTANASAGVWLTSADGNANAVCESGGAYLQYWTANPGFEIDDFNRGPAPIASVVFRNGNDSGGILMKVSCQGGVPVKQLVKLGPENNRPGE